VFIVGDINTETYSKLIKNLTILDKQSSPITIHLSSDGGDLIHAFAIYDIIKKCNSPVTICGYGNIFSCATIIMQAADTRQGTANSYFMLHSGYTGLNENMTHEQMVSSSRFEKRLMDKMLEIYEEVTSFSRSSLLRKLKTDWYLDASEAMEIGLIDEIV
jgi:ATP-dependent protease ClpP protease subunit